MNVMCSCSKLCKLLMWVREVLSKQNAQLYHIANVQILHYTSVGQLLIIVISEAGVLRKQLYIK